MSHRRGKRTFTRRPAPLYPEQVVEATCAVCGVAQPHVAGICEKCSNCGACLECGEMAGWEEEKGGVVHAG